MKQQNRVFMDFSKCKMKETFCTLFYALFVHFACYLFWTFSQWKMLLSSQNRVFRADRNYIKDMQINGESSVVVRDKKFHVEIRVLLMTCLFDLF